MDITTVSVLPASSTASWPCRACAAQRWTPAALCERFGSRLFDLGREDGSQCTLSSYLAAADPSRYIFDALPSSSDPLNSDYSFPPGTPQVPEEDFLYHICTTPQLRPRYRWFLVGLSGSGFTAHQDPNGTCAWNALVHGRKLWACLPPDTPLAAIFPGWDGSGEDGPPEQLRSAAGWFSHALPALQAAAAPGLQVFHQEEGEVVLLPAGWWHCVLTVSPVSVAITHNYLSAAGFERELSKLGAQSTLAALWRARVQAAGLLQGREGGGGGG